MAHHRDDLGHARRIGRIVHPLVTRRPSRVVAGHRRHRASAARRVENRYFRHGASQTNGAPARRRALTPIFPPPAGSVHPCSRRPMRNPDGAARPAVRLVRCSTDTDAGNVFWSRAIATVQVPCSSDLIPATTPSPWTVTRRSDRATPPVRGCLAATQLAGHTRALVPATPRPARPTGASDRAQATDRHR